MSTKCTLSYGPNFHLYSECFDDQNIYLEIEKTEFEANQDSIMITIQLEIWENIRTHTNARFDLITKTDEEIKTEVEAEVKHRIANYKEAEEKQQNTAFIELIGFLVCGSAKESYEEQVKRGIEYHIKERDKQIELLTKITAIKIGN